MTTIQSLPSSAIAVPAFGQGAPIQAPVRTGSEPLAFDRLAEAVLAQPAFALAGASMQPQLRTPDGIAIDEARIRDAIALVVDQHIPADAALQRSFERHAANTAEIADDVASSQDALSDAGRIKFDPFFALLALLAAAMQGMKEANRNLGVTMTEINTAAMKQVGQRAIDQATKNLAGSIAQGTLAVAAGTIAVGHTAQSAKITSDSVKQNVLPQQAAPKAGTMPTASSATPSPATSPTTSSPLAAVDDVDLPTAQPGLDVPDAAPSRIPQAQADDVAPSPQANLDPASDEASLLDAMKAAREGAHEVAKANAQTALGRAQFLNMIATPVSSTAASSAQLAAASDEAERLEKQAMADNARQIGNMHNEQASHDNELRDAAFQALQALSRREQANAQIIGNM